MLRDVDHVSLCLRLRALPSTDAVKEEKPKSGKESTTELIEDPESDSEPKTIYQEEEIEPMKKPKKNISKLGSIKAINLLAPMPDKGAAIMHAIPVKNKNTEKEFDNDEYDTVEDNEKNIKKSGGQH